MLMAKKNSAVVDIYTDGGCDPNPGVGGWAAVLLYKGNMKELSGHHPRSTNNRMEMTAAIEALSILKRPCTVRLHTDSEYLKKGVTEWMPKWKKKQWMRGNKPVKNKDLWMALDELISVHQVQWRWVRGHAGDALNERCDELATEAIQAGKGR